LLGTIPQGTKEHGLEKKIRLIIFGSVIGVLLLIALYMNLCSGNASVDSSTKKAFDAVHEKVEKEEQAQPKVDIPPPPPNVNPKSGFQRK
jgi:hypothetical protein